MIWALGLAASQPVGLRESFGSMNKSFNPGRAASSGIFAAMLASKNFTSSDGMIEAKRGWANTISTKQDYNEITGDLGKRYEAALNTYKPVACGIVMHPAMAEGGGGEKQCSDGGRADPTIVALRGRVIPTTTPGIDPAQVEMTIVRKDGRALNRRIEHAIGSVEMPMTDKQLETKFADLADGIIPAPSIRRVMDACWNVETLPNAAEIAKMSVSS